MEALRILSDPLECYVRFFEDGLEVELFRDESLFLATTFLVVSFAVAGFLDVTLMGFFVATLAFFTVGVAAVLVALRGSERVDERVSNSFFSRAFSASSSFNRSEAFGLAIVFGLGFELVADFAFGSEPRLISIALLDPVDTTATAVDFLVTLRTGSVVLDEGPFERFVRAATRTLLVVVSTRFRVEAVDFFKSVFLASSFARPSFGDSSFLFVSDARASVFESAFGLGSGSLRRLTSRESKVEVVSESTSAMRCASVLTNFLIFSTVKVPITALLRSGISLAETSISGPVDAICSSPDGAVASTSSTVIGSAFFAAATLVGFTTGTF